MKENFHNCGKMYIVQWKDMNDRMHIGVKNLTVSQPLPPFPHDNPKIFCLAEEKLKEKNIYR